MSASFWFIRPPVCMQVASIFLHPGRTTPAWAVASTPPIKKRSDPARPGPPHDSHKTPNSPVSTGVTVCPDIGVKRRREGRIIAGMDKKRGGKAAISGGGEASPRLFSRELFRSYFCDKDGRTAGDWPKGPLAAR